MIEINNLTSFAVDKKLFTAIAKKVLSGENKETETLSLVFVNKEEIKKLNKKFRGKDKPTDVLSFELKEKECLGEIVICPEIVKKNAKKFGVNFKKEIVKVFVHGIFHLLGYDHENSEEQAKKMEAKEEKYLSKLKV